MSLYNSALGYRELKDLLKDRDIKVHFIGVLGVSTYSLARLLRSMGYTVSGSDTEWGDAAQRLISCGINVFKGHGKENVIDKGLVIYSLSISEDNPEYLAAKELSIPLISRAELLGYLTLEYKNLIAVSGAHGKSTVTAMIDCILAYSKANFTTLCGADLSVGEPLRMMGTQTAVVEACEYKDSFLSLFPSHAVVLNIELDHVDYFSSDEELYLSFLSFVNSSKTAFINIDDALCKRLINDSGAKKITFGKDTLADYRYELNDKKSACFKLHHSGGVYGVKLSLIGEFSALNATAAIAVCHSLGISIEECVKAISTFRPINRRQEYIGQWQTAKIYTDYAHHPSEIRAIISAFKSQYSRPLAVIFKPHTFSRTKYFLSEFADALALADKVIICDIYPARESDDLGISSQLLADKIGKDAIYSPDESCAELLKDFEGDILIIGAGNIENVKKSFKK